MLGAETMTADEQGGGLFRARELSRVGVAATMMVFGGTAIILLMTIALGHYNSLAHCGPKAVLDGAVIALLIGHRGRWRMLALLGVVYGLVLLIQIGVAYLPLVMTLAGLIGAGAGGAAGWMNRRLGLIAAAVMFEWAASFGSPLKIYFGTGDANEPFLWALWMAEWPLRIGGATLGALMAARWAMVSDASAGESCEAIESLHSPAATSRGSHHVRGVKPAGVRLLVLLLATILPLTLESWSALSAINVLVLIYALILGPRRNVIHALIGVAWGYAVFAAASYLWHRDPDRVVDLVRTFALRFVPMAMASMVLIRSARPVDVLRVLRQARLPGVILFPLAVVLRQLPHIRRDIAYRIERLRRSGHWTGPSSMLRNPRTVLMELLWRPLQRWAGELAE